jgi:hypothetical protein
MAEVNDDPIPDDFEDGLVELISRWLAGGLSPEEERDLLHATVHPVAEEFVRYYFERADSLLSQGVAREEKQFLTCVAQVVFSYLLDEEELVEMTKELQLAGAWIALASWQAHRKVSDGTLDIPGLA